MTSVLPMKLQPDLALEGILHAVFQRPASGNGIVVAFTSANSGEGVGYVSRRIASQLATSRPESVLYTRSTQLEGEIWSGAFGLPDGYSRDAEVVANSAWEHWRSSVDQLRSRYRYSIVDCPSLSTRSDVLSLAPHVDGIVIVVAANETQKDQITNVERQIQMVNGKILGFVLNKRKYLVPRWLFKLL
jgi:hypothetical protein